MVKIQTINFFIKPFLLNYIAILLMAAVILQVRLS
jgi:hypothetical protein